MPSDTDPLGKALVGDPIALARIGVLVPDSDRRKVQRLTRRARRRMRVADWWMARAKRHTLRAQRILLGYVDGD